MSFREEYYYLDRNPRPISRVLMSLDLTSVGDTTKTDHPLIFIRRYGKGRVYVNVLGHFPETWRRQDYLDERASGNSHRRGKSPRRLQRAEAIERLALSAGSAVDAHVVDLEAGREFRGARDRRRCCRRSRGSG